MFGLLASLLKETALIYNIIYIIQKWSCFLSSIFLLRSYSPLPSLPTDFLPLTITQRNTQHLRRAFLAGTQWLAQQSILKGFTTVFSPQKDTRSAQPCNPLMVCLNLLLPIIDQYLTRRDRDLVDYCTERLALVRARAVGVRGTDVG